MEKELLLFSGGPDSTILLKYFLTIKKPIIVLNNNVQWFSGREQNLKIQKERVKKIIKFMKKKYGNFDFLEATFILPPIPLNSFEHWGTDDQWNTLIASMLSKFYNIKKIWHASFSYNFISRKEQGKEPPYWLLNMKPILNFGTNYDNKFKDLSFVIPRFFYNGKDIDSFKTKKEAWDYLGPELKKLVRSCEGNVDFCGVCYKCKTYISQKMTNEKGEII